MMVDGLSCPGMIQTFSGLEVPFLISALQCMPAGETFKIRGKMEDKHFILKHLC